MMRVALEYLDVTGLKTATNNRVKYNNASMVSQTLRSSAAHVCCILMHLTYSFVKILHKSGFHKCGIDLSRVILGSHVEILHVARLPHGIFQQKPELFSGICVKTSLISVTHSQYLQGSTLIYRTSPSSIKLGIGVCL